MICKLCKVREANKKNTHYLTDSIIRTCLNLDGSNTREAGFYFDISNNTPFVDFNFQRGTSVVELEKPLGRPATDEEIEKAGLKGQAIINLALNRHGAPWRDNTIWFKAETSYFYQEQEGHGRYSA